MLRMDYDKEKIIDAGVGAMLHDIGKSSIPKRILNKPGKLEPDEWELIKTHPVQGLGLCSMMSLSHTTLNCILMHHEKCDGSGYPCGLKQEALPLEIRILTCCDIYDAITSNRPYAKAESSFSALNTMRHHMKSALDMNVFSEFVLMLSDANITSR
jgi:HD-GYP domain-containing protein (c-di-GMP phosphodiesterase class II)